MAVLGDLNLYALFGVSLSEPQIHKIQEVALYVFVCLWGDYFHEQRVKLKFQLRTLVMVVKHMHVQL